MSSEKLAVVVLAAGLGTRLKSTKPKVLHQVAGRAILGHVLDAAAALAPERIVVVLGAGMAPAFEPILAGVEPRPRVVVQEARLGTGHALACARAALDGYVAGRGAGAVMVVPGDAPLLRAETLEALRRARQKAPDLVGLAFRPDDPGQYGRILLDRDGRVERIVEFPDASEEERRIGLCNGGLMLADGPLLFALVDRLGKDNARGEYYLPDVYALARAEGARSAMVEAEAEDLLGVNTRAELAVAEAVMQTRLRARAMAGGATLVDPSAVWLAADTRLGRDVTVQPNVYFGPGVEVGDDVEIRSFCHLEGARIAPGAVVGPFARLRPGTVIGPKARVGNFVEMKNAELGPGAKANHLSYLGDSAVGAQANIGAGTITCNYDGFAKHRTTIGEGAFIGSNTSLVAPVRVGDGAIVGAGSTITRDVGDQAVAVARGEQRESPGAAARLRQRRAAAGKGGKRGRDEGSK